MKYAASTEVSPEKSKLEIEKTLTRYGATGFICGWGAGTAFIMFEHSGRRVKYFLPLPNRQDDEFTKDKVNTWKTVAKSVQEARYEQALKQRWRALALAIKAKLEIVESGITTLEREFMNEIIMPDGQTLGDHLIPQIKHAYESGRMPPLLGPGSGS